MLITTISQIEEKNINWQALGARIKSYRKNKELSIESFAKQCNTTSGTLESLEAGISRRDMNCIWRIKESINISLNWLLNGIDNPDSTDPPELLPPTIIVQRGHGIKFNQETEDISEGQYNEIEMEFVLAIDSYKRINKVLNLKWTEVLRIISALGYRKIANPTIFPKRSSSKQNII
jgi:transcriptional regulator with XRE-family HTH domain